MEWAYYFATGLENLSTMLSFWVDFIMLFVITMYFLHLRNPVLRRRIQKVKWCTEESSSLQDEASLKNVDITELKLDQVVNKYNNIYCTKYPNQAIKDNQQRRFDMQQANPDYRMAHNMQAIVYLCFPILTVVLILAMALMNKAIISLGYVLPLLYIFMSMIPHLLN